MRAVTFAPSVTVRPTVQNSSCDRPTRLGRILRAATVAIREADPEGHLDVLEVVALLVLDLVRRHVDLEAVRLRTPRRHGVDVDGRAGGDPGEQEPRPVRAPRCPSSS